MSTKIYYTIGDNFYTIWKKNDLVTLVPNAMRCFMTLLLAYKCLTFACYFFN